MRSSRVRPLLILGPIFAGCSYDFGGSPDGDGGSAATSTVTGFTSAQSTGANVTQASNATTTTTTNATDPTTASSVLAASSSTGPPVTPLALCGNFGDPFDGDSGHWLFLNASVVNGSLLALPGDFGGQIPFDIGGALSTSTYPIDECTLSVRGIFIATGPPRVGVAAADVNPTDPENARWLALMWNGTTVSSEVRDGGITPGPSMQIGAVDRLTIHFTGGMARFYADTTFVGEMARPGWLGQPRGVFAGALDSGSTTIDEFNPQLNTTDVP